MHVPFKIHYRNNLIDKKDSYLILRPPSWGGAGSDYTCGALNTSPVFCGFRAA
jgi:hypothetical protein